MKLETGTTIIGNGTLVDGTGAAPVANACVLVRDGRIDYAGTAQDAPPVPDGARRIDANGGSIMPGLVEAHFHATYFGRWRIWTSPFVRLTSRVGIEAFHRCERNNSVLRQLFLQR